MKETLDIYGDWLIKLIYDPTWPIARRWRAFGYNTGPSRAFLEMQCFPTEEIARTCMRMEADEIAQLVTKKVKVDRYIGTVFVSLLWQLRVTLGDDDPGDPLVWDYVEQGLEGWPFTAYREMPLRTYKQFMSDYQIPLPRMFGEYMERTLKSVRHYSMHFIYKRHERTRLPKVVRVLRRPGPRPRRELRDVWTQSNMSGWYWAGRLRTAPGQNSRLLCLGGQLWR